MMFSSSLNFSFIKIIGVKLVFFTSHHMTIFSTFRYSIIGTDLSTVIHTNPLFMVSNLIQKNFNMSA